MPIGISHIMKRKYPLFTANQLESRINDYFINIKAEPQPEENSPKEIKPVIPAKAKKLNDTATEPVTITGLAYHLGFSSLQVFDDYTKSGKLSSLIKRARLRIEAEYEKKLHLSSPSGAIFALKSLGWNERVEDRSSSVPVSKTLKVQIIETGPIPAATEKEVILED